MTVIGVSWMDGRSVQWLIDPERYSEPVIYPGLYYSPCDNGNQTISPPAATAADFARLDPKVAFLELMEAQRRLTFETTAGGIHCVGGRCDLATVTERGVKLEVLRRWPDRRNSTISL